MSACSSTREESGISQRPASAVTQQTLKTAEQAQLFASSTAAQSYTVIKEVKVVVNKTTAFHPDPTILQVEERLKKTAAGLGGDAVVNVDISDVKVRAFSWGGRTGTGSVVRY